MRGPFRQACGVLIPLIVALSALVNASSVARNPLTRLGFVRDAVIRSPQHRVTAKSEFDLSFDLEGRRVRFSLEPNDDLIPNDATVQFLGQDGSVTHSEPLNRLDFKIFKGRTTVQQVDGDWIDVGWARVLVKKDGNEPLFVGAFSVYGDDHHILSSTEYTETKHELDPSIEPSDAEYLVVIRDSDISDEGQHIELRRRKGLAGIPQSEELTCRSEQLSFNSNPNHPVFRAEKAKRDDHFWAAAHFNMLLGRQSDIPGAGNSAGVNLSKHIGSKVGCPTTRKVALVGVATDCSFAQTFSSHHEMRRYVIHHMNSASRVYEESFNFSLALRNLTVMPQNCPGEVQTATPWNQECGPAVNIQDRLNLFSQWRGEQHDGNSHWTLLTKCNTGAAVGLAWLGQACKVGSTTENLAGGASETVAGANLVAKVQTEWQVIAHETGHTFGAVHDCDAETCSDGHTVAAQQCCPLSKTTCDADGKYIMNPSTAPGIKQFSPCTIGNICTAIGRNSVKTDCLKDNTGVTTITGPVCGNGIVEGNEECDCGGVENCGDNQCCDPKTCKFINGAVCDDANEDCCQSCQLASSGSVCRPKTGPCDIAEKCSGKSPVCPKDRHLPDGQDCGNGLQCASGQCTSRDMQCKTLMGSYTQGNDTYACDSTTCTISCASPEFGSGVCLGLQQNFLDGTDCGGGGTCQNGQCEGASFAGEVGSWIDDHKPLVIGLASAIGGLILLSILGCLWRCFRNRKRPRSRPTRRPVHHGPPSMIPGIPRSSRGHRFNRDTQQQPLMSQAGAAASTSSAWMPPPPRPAWATPHSSFQSGYGGSWSGQPPVAPVASGANGPGPGAWGYGGTDQPMQQPSAAYRGQSVRYA